MKQSTKPSLNLKMNIPEYPSEQLTLKNDMPAIINENYSLHEGICEGIGDVTVLVLYNFKRLREQFFRVLTGINIFINLNTVYFAKLYGFSMDDMNFSLIFEHLSSSLSQSLFKRALTEDEKYRIVLEITQLIELLHHNNFRTLDLKPSNLYLNDQRAIKMIFPIDNIHLFKKVSEEDNDILINIISNEDIVLRFLPPEKLQEHPFQGNANDIWMLGCLLIELFSKEKVWNVLTENEIIQQLKKYQSPLIPRDIPQALWTIISDCLNPYHEERSNINNIIPKYIAVLQKLHKDHIVKMVNLSCITRLLPSMGKHPVNLLKLTNQPIKEISSDNSFFIQSCYLHSKILIDQICTKCNDIICPKCDDGIKKHEDHSEYIKTTKEVVLETKESLLAYMSKFRHYVDEKAKHLPLDDRSKEFIIKQKNLIENMYLSQLDFINNHFDSFHQKLEILKEIEINNLNKFKAFFLSKFDDFDLNVQAIINEKSRIESEVTMKLNNLINFNCLDRNTKTDIIKTLPNLKPILIEDKQNIMNKFKTYQLEIFTCDKIKHYFQRAMHNLKDNKIYQFNTIINTFQSQLQTQYAKLNLHEYFNIFQSENEDFTLLNSRNCLSPNIKDIYIAISCTNNVISFNIPNNTYTQKEIDFCDTQYENFHDFSRNININGFLYINGGFDLVNKVYFKTHLEYNPLTDQLVQCEDMLYSHSVHSLLYVPSQYIYVISGSGTTKCERYDLIKCKWMEISEINYDRQNCSLFYHGLQYLYAFGGLSYDGSIKDYVFVDMIERLCVGFDMIDPTAKWETISVINKTNNVNMSKSIISIIPIHPNKILMVGGLYKNQTYSDDVILFDFEKGECCLTDTKLTKRTCFSSKAFLFQGDYAYQFDKDGDVHEFSLKDFTFKVVNRLKSDFGY